MEVKDIGLLSLLLDSEMTLLHLQKLPENFQTIPFVDVLFHNVEPSLCTDFWKFKELWMIKIPIHDLFATLPTVICWLLRIICLSASILSIFFEVKTFTLFITERGTNFISPELRKGITVCISSLLQLDKKTLKIFNLFLNTSNETIFPVNRWYVVMIYNRTFIVA